MIKYKNIAILGLGCSGLATYNYLCQYPISIVAWDNNQAVRNKYQQKVCLQAYENWDFATLDLIIVSPGIKLHYPQEHFVLSKAREYQIKICCDIELFYELNPSKNYIAVTGTNGKSTVVSLVHQIFIAQNKKAVLLGNIGNPVFATNVVDVDYIILELSSFQLDLISNFRFQCAMFLNLAKDHLDYHGTFKNYSTAKEKIFHHQSQEDIAIINQSLPINIAEKLTTQKLLVVGQDIYIKANQLIDNYFHQQKAILDLSKIKYLQGEHNQENIMFAYACSQFFNLDVSMQELINNFHNLAHRQNLVLELDNISFINDSKATSPEATLVALKNFNNIILILGGVQKRDEIDVLLPYLKSKVIHTFLIGASSNLFAKILTVNKLSYSISIDLNEAVKSAYDLAKSSKKAVSVLFSPACASYDMFTNFQVRGEAFIKLVQGLK